MLLRKVFLKYKVRWISWGISNFGGGDTVFTARVISHEITS
jgi:hypothetical protein